MEITMEDVSNPETGIDTTATPEPVDISGMTAREALRARREQANSEPEQLAEQPEHEEEANSTEEGEQLAETEAQSVEEEVDGYVLIDNEEVSYEQLREWKQDGLRYATFTKKMQEVSQQRKDAEASQKRFQEQTQQTERNLAAALERLQAAQSVFMPPEPDPALATSDPFAYNEQKARFEAAERQIAEAIGAARQNLQQQQEAHNQQLNARHAELHNFVREKAPDIFDPSKKAEHEANFATVAKECGYTDAELANVNDPRLGLLLMYASRGFAAQDKAAQAVAKAPKMERKTARKGKPSAQSDYERLHKRIAAQQGGAQIGDVRALLKAKRKARS